MAAKIKVFTTAALLCLLICICIGASEASRLANMSPQLLSDPKLLKYSKHHKFNPKMLKKCFDDSRVEYICMREILASLWFKSMKIEGDCCRVVEEFNEDCSHTVFERFQSPFFKNLLKDYCNNNNNNSNNNNNPSPPGAPTPTTTSSLVP